MKKALLEDEQRGHRKKENAIPIGANYGTIAKIVKDPHKLSKLHNSYQHYKIMGGLHKPDILNYKQSKREAIQNLA